MTNQEDINFFLKLYNSYRQPNPLGLRLYLDLFFFSRGYSWMLNINYMMGVVVGLLLLACYQVPIIPMVR